MTQVRTASFIQRWGINGEQFLTLYGPKGSSQDISLGGSAVEQIDKGWLQRERDELLANLKHAVSVLEDWDDNVAADEGPCETVVELRAVIAKAEGRA